MAIQAVVSDEDIIVQQELPVGVPATEIIVASKQRLWLNDRAILSSYDGRIPVATATTEDSDVWSQSRVGADTSTGHLYLAGSLELADRATVNGNLSYNQSLWRGNRVSTFGSVSKEPLATEVVDLVRIHKATGKPANAMPEVFSGGDVTLSPGVYTSMKVNGNGILRLTAGNYETQSLKVEGQGTLIVDTSLGPVRLVVTGSEVILNGSVREEQNGVTNLAGSPVKFLLLAQNASVHANQLFEGVIVAPNGMISVQGLNGNKPYEQRGAYFGRFVTLHQHGHYTGGFERSLLWEDTAIMEGAGDPKNVQRFVPHLGFLDGADCSSWPLALEPSEYLANLLALVGSSSERGSDVAWLWGRMMEQGLQIDPITALGSSRSLVLASYQLWEAGGTNATSHWVAVDEEAGTAYDLSYQRLCTRADLEGGNCTKRWQTISWDGTPQKLEVLGLTSERVGRRSALEDEGVLTVLLAAPEVRLAPAPSEQASSDFKVALDVNLIVVADKVHSNTLKPDGSLRKASLEVRPFTRPLPEDWKTDAVAPAKPGLLAVYADEIAGIGTLASYPGVRIQKLAFFDELTDYASDGTTVPTLHRDTVNYQADNGTADTTLENVVMLPKREALSSWTMSTSSTSTTETITSAMPGFWCADPANHGGDLNVLCTAPGTKVGNIQVGVTQTTPTYELNLWEPSDPTVHQYRAGGVVHLAARLGATDVGLIAPPVSPLGVDAALLPTTLTQPPYPTKLLAHELLTSNEPGKQLFATGLYYRSDFEASAPHCKNAFVKGYRGPTQWIWNGTATCNAIPTINVRVGTGEMFSTTRTSVDPRTALLDPINAKSAPYAITPWLNQQIINAWAPQGESPAPLVKRSTGPEALRTAAQIISNGLYFNTLYQDTRTQSLQLGSPTAGYQHLREILGSIDPENNLQIRVTEAVATEVLQLAAAVDQNPTSPPLNALGLPTGDYAAPWSPAWADPLNPPLALSDVKARWERVSEQQQKLGELVEEQVKVDDVRLAIESSAALLAVLQQHATELASLADGSTTDQVKAMQTLATASDHLATAETVLVEGVRDVLDQAGQPCPDCSMDVMIERIGGIANNAIIACNLKQVDSGWALLNTLAEITPYINTVAAAAGPLVKKLQDSEYTGPAGRLARLISGCKAQTVRCLTDKEKERTWLDTTAIAARSTSEALGTMRTGLSKFRQPSPTLDGCPQQDAQFVAATSLMLHMQSLQTLIDSLAVQAETITGILESIRATLDYLSGERDINNNLSTELGNLAGELPSANEAGDIRKEIARKASLISQACRIVQHSTIGAEKDLYALSSMLQTSAGRATVSPSLMIPAEDKTLQTPTGDESFPYVVNIWDNTGFSTLFGETTYIDRAETRFTELVWNNVCNKDTRVDSRPNTLVAIRYVLQEEALDRFFETGYVDFPVGLGELADATQLNYGRGRDTAAIAGYTINGWIPLAAPVVYGAKYTPCNGDPDGIGGPCCNSAVECRSSSMTDNNLWLLRGNHAQIPRACSEGETANRFLVDVRKNEFAQYDYQAMAETCLASVETPPVAQSVTWLEPGEALVDGLADNDARFCGGELPVDLSPNGLEGTPLLGTWTLADNDLLSALSQRWIMGSDGVSGETIPVEPISRPADVTAIEIYLFAGSEPQASLGPASYVLKPLGAEED